MKQVKTILKQFQTALLQIKTLYYDRTAANRGVKLDIGPSAAGAKAGIGCGTRTKVISQKGENLQEA